MAACNDDGCTYGDFYSKIENLLLEPGHDYYIVVDGYGGSFGEYGLTITALDPCPLPCPEGAVHEGEPPCVDGYTDTYNAGCDGGFTEIQAQACDCGTMCGRSCTFSYNGYAYRDTDWYTARAVGGQVTATCTASFPLQFILIYGTDCSNLMYNYIQVAYCEPAFLAWNSAPGAELWFWVGPSVFEGVPELPYLLDACGITGAPIPSSPVSWGRVKATYR